MDDSLSGATVARAPGNQNHARYSTRRLRTITARYCTARCVTLGRRERAALAPHDEQPLVLRTPLGDDGAIEPLRRE